MGHRIREQLQHFPALLLTGARQTGKTTLLKHELPDWHLVTLDLPSTAEEAEKRPDTFLARNPPPVVIDEVQYAPSIFRHLKVAIDRDRDRNGRFVLTGSQKLHLLESISESLAGRCALLELHTLSAAEYAREGEVGPRAWMEFLVRGGYPELCAEPERSAADFYRAYVATYLERDVRNLLQVGNLRDFERFLRASAARSAGLLNLADLSRDVGVAPSTARQWLSVLQASGIVHLLEPYFANFGKRLVKSPKLYFLDTGLLCFLLGLSSSSALLESPFAGSVWETFVLGQILREIQTRPTAASIWFWRDAHGLEADFLIDLGSRFEVIEAKLTEVPGPEDTRAVEKVLAILRSSRPARARLASRPAHAFPVTGDVDAVNAFEERSWLRE